MRLQSTFFVPAIVRHNHRSVPWTEWIRGSVLFADVSGFTALSEALAGIGSQGAELLTDILNRYFSEMIGIIDRSGGQVMTFGGDAMLCLFPGERSLPRCVAAATAMQNAMDRFRMIRTPIKRFTLRMKIGIAHGDNLLGCIGGPGLRAHYFIAGEAVDLSAAAEHHAQAGDVIVAFPAGIVTECGRLEQVDDCFWRVLEACDPSWPDQAGQSTENRADEFILPELKDMFERGYERYIGALRSVVPVFVQYTGFSFEHRSFDMQRFNAFFAMFQKTVSDHSGIINQVSMGDKGSSLYLLFGAPRPLENREERAAAWSLECISRTRKEFPEVSLKIGMSSGQVFTGVVGGHQRFDYTAMGDVVNLAARLMQSARPFTAFVSTPFQQAVDSRYAFTSEGTRQLKGKKEPVSIYALEGRRSMSGFPGQGRTLIGRDSEHHRILNEIGNGEHTRFIVISGEAGIGKSELARHVLSLKHEQGYHVYYCWGGSAGQQAPYEPIRQLARSLFFRTSPVSVDLLREKIRECDERYLELLPLFAEFFFIPGIATGSDLPEETRQKLFQLALARMMVHLLDREPSILFIEDLHAFDSRSREYLLQLLTAGMNHRLVILATARPEWDSADFSQRSCFHEVRLEGLTQEATMTLAEDELGTPVRDDLCHFVHLQTRGNPLLVLSLVRHLHHRDELEKRLGVFVLRKGIELTEIASIENLILSELQTLSMIERIHLVHAACMGTSFPEEVIRHAMGKRFRRGVWRSLFLRSLLTRRDEKITAFVQPMLRETLYRSLSHRQRSTIHRRLCTVIEHLYRHERNQWLPVIAYHAINSGNRRKLIDASYEAGLSLYEKNLYLEAGKFLHQAFHGLKYSRDERKWGAGLILCKTLKSLGEYEQVMKLLISLERAARAGYSVDYQRELVIIRLSTLSRQSDFNFIPQARTFLRVHTSATQSQLNEIRFLLAAALHRKGNYTEARAIFSEIITMPDDEMVVPALIQLAAIEKIENNRELAITYLNDAVETARQRQLPYRELQALMEKLNLYIETNDAGSVDILQNHVLTLAEDLGDKLAYATILLNMGKFWLDMQHFNRARLMLHEAHEIFASMGSHEPEALALNHLGMLSFYKNNFIEAFQFYDCARIIAEPRENPATSAMIYGNLAEVCHALEKYGEGNSWLFKAKKAALKANDPQLQAFISSLEGLFSSTHS